jgi:hypothetical protein
MLSFLINQWVMEAFLAKQCPASHNKTKYYAERIGKELDYLQKNKKEI